MCICVCVIRVFWCRYDNATVEASQSHGWPRFVDNALVRISSFCCCLCCFVETARSIVGQFQHGSVESWFPMYVSEEEFASACHLILTKLARSGTKSSKAVRDLPGSIIPPSANNENKN